MKTPRLFRRRSLSVLFILFAGVSMLSAQGTLLWQNIASGTTAGLWGIAASGSRIVAVGERGEIVAGDPAGGVTLRTSGTTRWLTAVAYGAGRWIAVGDAGTLLTSDNDGLTWVQRNSGTDYRLNGIAFGDGRWLAVGEGGTVISSVDGGNSWTGFRLPDVGFLRALTFGRSTFLFGGEAGALFTTVDGQHVTRLYLNTQANIEAAAISGELVVVSGSQGLVAASPFVPWQWEIQTGLAATENYRCLQLGLDQTRLLVGEHSAVFNESADDGPGFPAMAMTVVGSTPYVVGLGGGMARLTNPTTLRIVVDPAAEWWRPFRCQYGEPLYLRAQLTGFGALPAYQWAHDGEPLPGETSGFLLRDRTGPTDAGMYAVRVSAEGQVYEAERLVHVVPGGRPDVEDSSFASALPDVPSLLHPLPDGRLLVAGGNMRTTDTATFCGLVRLRRDGSTDTDFHCGIALSPTRVVGSIATEPDGRIYLTLYAAGSPGEAVVRLEPGGAIDPSFQLDSELAEVAQVLPTASGPYVLATSGGVQRVVKLRADGSIASGFTPTDASGILGEDPKGRLLIVGPYELGGRVVRRLFADGSIDPSYQAVSQEAGPLGFSSYDLMVGEELYGMGGMSTRWGAIVHAFHLDGSGRKVWEGPGSPPLLQSPPYLEWSYLFRPDGGIWSIWVRDQAFLSAIRSQAADGRSEPPRYATLVDGAPVRLLRLAADGSLYVATRFYGADERVPSRASALTRVRPVSGKPGRLSNLSVRAGASAAAPLIVGFVTNGSGQSRVLLRAIGPTLRQYDVTDALADPQLELVRDARVVAGNDQWPLALTGRFAEAGAFALPAGSADAALEAELPAGQFSALARPARGTAAGTTLIELYHLNGHATGTPLFINASARGPVGPETPLIAGFVITGDVPMTVLLRGVGPTLAQYGVPNPLPDPRLTLYRGPTPLWENNDWSFKNPTLDDSRASTGAFELPGESADAAMCVTLAPGVYSAVLQSASEESSGTALIELYLVASE